jgi:hypothetical protein
VVELVAVPTKITGVHYVQGVVVFHDVFDNEQNVGGAQINLEGVYIWPFRQLRLVANSGKESDSGQEDNNLLSNPYHLVVLKTTIVLSSANGLFDVLKCSKSLLVSTFCCCTAWNFLLSSVSRISKRQITETETL